MTSPSTRPSLLPCSPYATAVSPLSQRPPASIRARPSTSSSLTLATTTTTTTTTATTMTAATATAPPAGAGPSPTIESMAPRTVLRSGPRPPTALWQPTRQTSPYCVLSAAGLQEDFYTSCLSWGTNQMALGLPDDVVIFHPSHPREAPSRASIRDGKDGESSVAANQNRTVTAVSMSRSRELACFVGLSGGAVELYEGRGDGELSRTMAFQMPAPPTDYLNSLMTHDGPTARRAGRALALLRSSVSSITCMSTSGRHPWLAAVATSARGVLTVDARVPAPSLWFGTESQRLTEERCAVRRPPSPPFSSAADALAGEEDTALSRLQRASTFLRQHDRLCSVAWNATGSLVATGSGSGVVKVWSLSSPQRPVHSFLVDGECSVKALAFHPSRPYEMLVGASAGPAGLRSYDLSGSDPVLLSCGATAAAITQALYDPEGNFAVTTAGTPLPLPPAPSASSPVRAASGGGEAPSPTVGAALLGSPRWRHPASPTHSGAGRGASGGSRGPSSAVALLEDSWADAEEALADTSPFTERRDTMAGSSAAAAAGAADGGFSDGYVTGSPTSLSASAGVPSSAAAALVAHRSPPNAVVVWRSGARRRESSLRDALFPGPAARDADGDGEGERDPRSGRSAYASAASAEWRTGAAAAAEDGFPVSEWVPFSSQPGHRARPLLICAPFAQSPFAGCCATIAGGDDGTIRFWRLFEAVSDATHWHHRRQAQQQSATTREDLDLFATPVLR